MTQAAQNIITEKKRGRGRPKRIIGPTIDRTRLPCGRRKLWCLMGMGDNGGNNNGNSTYKVADMGMGTPPLKNSKEFSE